MRQAVENGQEFKFQIHKDSLPLAWTLDRILNMLRSIAHDRSEELNYFTARFDRIGQLFLEI